MTADEKRLRSREYANKWRALRLRACAEYLERVKAVTA